MSSRHSQGTRALTEGALLAALTIVLYVANVYTQLLIYVIPVPVAILVVRNGLRAGAVASVVSALGVGLVLGPIDGITVLIRVALVGLVMGGLMAKPARAMTTLLATAAAQAGVVITDFLIVAATSGLSPSAMLERLQNAMAEAASQSSAMYERLGVPQQALEQAKAMAELLPQWFEMFLPTILMGGALLAALIAYSTARWILRRTKVEVEALPPFGQWRLGWQWAWGLIAALLVGQFILSGRRDSRAPGEQRGYDLRAAVHGVRDGSGLGRDGALQGAGGLQGVPAVHGVCHSPFNWALTLAGLLDGWVDFRRLVRRRQG